MLIIFSDHAKIQLKRRGIAQKVVKKAILNTEEILPSFRNRKLHRSTVDAKLLEVVTKTENEAIVVITAYFLEE